MNKLLQYFAYLTLITAFGLLFLTGYWLLQSYTPIIFNKLPFPVVNRVVKAGDFMIYTVNYCKSNTLIPLATKTFNNGIIYVVPAEIVMAKDKGCAVINVQIFVPLTLPPDTYTVKIVYRYQVNPIKTVDVVAETEPFTVTE